MRVTILRHAPYEDAGFAEQHLRQRYAAQLNLVMMHEPGYRLPALDDVDLLLICGGPMGATDEAIYPWIAEEKRFIRAAIEANKAVLGICLGGQMIAAALGAQISINPQPEVGWYPLQSLPCVGCFNFPDMMVMQWHYQTFALPEGAQLLASTESCTNQAYQLGDRVIGLQCHPEMTAEVINYLVTNFPEELEPRPGVQSAVEIQAGIPQHMAKANGVMAEIVNYLVHAIA